MYSPIFGCETAVQKLHHSDKLEILKLLAYLNEVISESKSRSRVNISYIFCCFRSRAKRTNIESFKKYPRFFSYEISIYILKISIFYKISMIPFDRAKF